MNTIALDTETFYRLGKTATPSIKSQGTWKYTHDPEFEVLLISVCDGKTCWAGPPNRFDWEQLRGHRIVSHNAAFDRAVYRRMVEDGAAPAGLEENWNCTANMVAYLSGSKIRSLKDASAKWLGEEVSKEVRDNLAGKRLKDLLADGTYKATCQYALKDAVNCWKLWDKLSAEWPEVEHEASMMTLEHSVLGVRIDVERLKRDIASLQEAIWRTEKVIPWVEQGYKPGSPVALAEECRKYNIPAPPTKEEDEEGFIIWERTYGPIHPWVGAVARMRSLKKVLSGHEHVANRLRDDGRFDFGLLYCGAHTGRWSGTGGFNMQNLRANSLVVDLDKAGEIIPPAEAKKRKIKEDAGPIRVINQRALFQAGEGYELAQLDLAQIEPRLLHWTTGNVAMLEKVAGGMSVYEAYARVTPAGNPIWTAPGDMKTGNPLLYKATKIQVLQLGYGSGWQTFLAQALDNDLEMDEAGARKVVDDFRAANPAIVEFWGALGAGLRDVANTFHKDGEEKPPFVQEMPNGRKLVYSNIRRQLQKIEVDEDGHTRARYGIAADTGQKRSFLYGGKLAENFIQALAREAFAEKAVGLRKMGLRILWTVHDEAVMELKSPSKDLHHSIMEWMRKPIDWLPDCPLDAELSIVPYYTK